MVDSGDFVDGSNIDVRKLASTFISSYLLASLAGLASFLYAFFEAPANLINDGLTWVGETLGLGFIVPGQTLETSWEVAANAFPIAGAFDWMLGVLLVIVFFMSVNWMLQQVREGI